MYIGKIPVHVIVIYMN